VSKRQVDLPSRPHEPVAQREMNRIVRGIRAKPVPSAELQSRTPENTILLVPIWKSPGRVTRRWPPREGSGRRFSWSGGTGTGSRRRKRALSAERLEGISPGPMGRLRLLRCVSSASLRWSGGVLMRRACPSSSGVSFVVTGVVQFVGLRLVGLVFACLACRLHCEEQYQWNFSSRSCDLIRYSPLPIGVFACVAASLPVYVASHAQHLLGELTDRWRVLPSALSVYMRGACSVHSATCR
jgi:hypothetical protein